MAEIDTLKNILKELACDVSKAYTLKGIRAFNAYYEFINSMASPYVRNGFLDVSKACQRFISETAMLHMATTLFEEWCLRHEIGNAQNFFSIHQAGMHFSWYEISKKIKSEIIDWVNDNPDIQDAPQVLSLLAGNTLLDSHRRSLGEFYTPTKIAEHLYSLTDFDANKINDKKIVDPSCGSGNLLKILVSDVVRLVVTNKLDASIALNSLNSNIYGYDIQPVAILITKLQLLLASLPIIEQASVNSKNIYEILPFKNIELADPLKNPTEYWDIFANFDLVIGNPPFLKVIKNKLSSSKEFDSILAGQPNLYQLFLWWAIKATRADGTITFIIPQSIRSGQYFSKLRKELSKFCEIKFITTLNAQQGVFDSVKQPMMIISLTKSKNRQESSLVSIRKGNNGNGLTGLKRIIVPHQKVVFENGSETLWCISDSEIDYQIFEKAYENAVLIKDLNEVDILNGGFVWNQNKAALRSVFVSEASTLPLISSGSIGVHEFTFPPNDKRLEDRIFVERAYSITQPSYSTRSILIKRTTPKKMRGRRIIACKLPEKFIEDYPVYFCENHVNLVLPKNGSKIYLIGLTAWLNSSLTNFLFGMLNGSSHISKYEIMLLPISLELLDLLSGIKINDRKESMRRIDEAIFNFYQLDYSQIKRITQVVPSIT